MGVVISFLKRLIEGIAKENRSRLYIGGAIITFIVVSSSGLFGWIIERLFLFFELKSPILSTLFFAFILSSSLASRSLNKSILEILNLISNENLRDNLKDSLRFCFTKKDWLTKDENIVNQYINDPYCMQTFSSQFYNDLVEGVLEINEIL